MRDFLVIGNLNAVTYKEVFPLIKAGKVRLGVSIHGGDREFEVAADYSVEAAGYRVNSDGRKFIRVKGVRWFTTLEHDKHNPPISLTKRYDPANYPKYDNCDAIEVSRAKDIPRDYYGVMGVPISFLDKWCPGQFEIIGNEDSLNIAKGRCYLNGKRLYAKILIKRK